MGPFASAAAYERSRCWRSSASCRDWSPGRCCVVLCAAAPPSSVPPDVCDDERLFRDFAFDDEAEAFDDDDEADADEADASDEEAVDDIDRDEAVADKGPPTSPLRCPLTLSKSPPPLRSPPLGAATWAVTNAAWISQQTTAPSAVPARRRQACAGENTSDVNGLIPTT